jgi:hypothetical protein
MSMTIAEALAAGATELVDDSDDDRRKDASRPPTLGRRVARRRRVLLSALVVDLDSEAIVSCRVENVSDNGARIKLAERRFLPPTFWLIAVTSGLAFPAKTVWREDDRLGIEAGLSVDLSDPSNHQERRLQKIWMSRAR